METAEPERWAWKVTYEDGTELKQFGDDGKFHQFREIDQPNVGLFCMYMMENEAKRFQLVIHAGVQLFHFYRNSILAAGTSQESRIKTYNFGWKDRTTGSSVYFVIMPDDEIIAGPADILQTFSA